VLAGGRQWGEEGTDNARCWVDGAREGVDGDNVGGLSVPGAVLAPVCDGDVAPGVVEGAVVLKDSHGDVVGVSVVCCRVWYGEWKRGKGKVGVDKKPAGVMGEASRFSGGSAAG